MKVQEVSAELENDEWIQWTLQQYVEKDAVFFAVRGWLKLKSVNKYTEKDF
jgi:hypothetical protein